MFTVSSGIDLVLSIFLAIHVLSCWYWTYKNEDKVQAVLSHSLRKEVVKNSVGVFFLSGVFFTIIYGVILWRFSSFIFSLGAASESAWVLITLVSMFALFRVWQRILFREMLIQFKLLSGS